MLYEHRRQDWPFFVQPTAASIRVNKASVQSAARPGYPNFIVKFVEAHGCGRRPQASRHLTFQPDAAPSHGKCRADEPHIHIEGRNSGRVVVLNNVSDRGTTIVSGKYLRHRTRRESRHLWRLWRRCPSRHKPDNGMQPSADTVSVSATRSSSASYSLPR